LCRHFQIESRTIENGFKANVNVLEWAKRDTAPEDWRIPLTFTSGATSAEVAGTTIKITNLTPEVKTRLRDPAFTFDLRNAISKTYLLFLDRYGSSSAKFRRSLGCSPWQV
jgi:hypothetical protein